MRRTLPLAFLALLALAPLAAAQAPDPGALVGAACATVGGVNPDVEDALPVCPRAPDPAPAEPAAAHEHPAAPPAKPQDAQQLAQDAVDAAQGAVQDPASAPSRLVGLVATVVQFVKDVLTGIGGGLHAGSTAVGHGFVAGLEGAKDGVVHAAGAAKDAAAHGLDAVKALFHREAPAPAAAPTALPHATLPAKGALRVGLVERATSALRQG